MQAGRRLAVRAAYGRRYSSFFPPISMHAPILTALPTAAPPRTAEVKAATRSRQRVLSNLSRLSVAGGFSRSRGAEDRRRRTDTDCTTRHFRRLPHPFRRVLVGEHQF